MSKKRITEIEFIKRETFVISQTLSAVRPVCRECGAETMIRLEEAGAISKINLRQIFRLIEAGTIHFDETSEGEFYVCIRSLTSELFLPAA